MDRRDFLKSAALLCALGVAARVDRAIGGETKSSSVRGVVRRRYKNTAIELPLLGFGMMRLPLRGRTIDKAKSQAMVDRAMAAGINYFDTAYFYLGGQSESFVGEALRKYPRDSYFVVSKMPVRKLKRASDLELIFQEQLRKCRVDHFDFYMLHALNAKMFDLAERLKAYDFLKQKKAAGKIRYLGFSFHDTPEVLTRIADAHEWDFAQIQLNYLDWELYRSREQYELLTSRKIPVIVMEPLRGGKLANLPEKAARILKNAAPNSTPAAWAFRYAASLPNVMTILSGMSRMDYLEENIRLFQDIKPLNEQEQRVLAAALRVLRNIDSVACTGCHYCKCPSEVAIPEMLKIYNEYLEDKDLAKFRKAYQAFPTDKRAENCVACGRCVKACPQMIRIPEEMAKIVKLVKK